MLRTNLDIPISKTKKMAIRHIWNKTNKYMTDGISLIQILGHNQLSSLKSNKSIQTTRDILIHQSKQKQNKVAISILHLQREMNNIQYHGLTSYIRQTFPHWVPNLSRSFITDNKISNSNLIKMTNVTKMANQTKVAKVAFMITSKQRLELMELGYTTKQIKSLIPMEANLILHHQLLPSSNFKEELKQLVDQYEKQQKEMNQVAITQNHSNMEIVDDLPKTLPKKLSVDSMESEINNDENIKWFEVVETISNKSDTQNCSVIGLYKTENEAIECCNIKESMHDKAKKNSSYKSLPRFYQVRPKQI